jgi:heptosyltransferase-1
MRILIVKLSSLGDLFHALPAVHNLKMELDASIHWVTNTSYVELVECFTDVDHVIGFPRHSLSRDFREFYDALRADHYDMIIDLQGLMKSALITRFARGDRRIGPSYHREGSRLFYNKVAGPRNIDRHAVDQALDIINHLDLNRLPPAFPVEFPSPPPTALSPRVAICPTSRWETKNWPLDRFAAVASELQDSIGASITLLGGPGEIDACDTIASQLSGPCENLAGKTSLVKMGGILKNMDLLIANDSGPVHMAAAIGTPTLVIFGPTKPERTGPYGEIHRVIKTAFPCQPCYKRTCKQPDIPCISGVKVYQVVEAAKEMLKL